MRELEWVRREPWLWVSTAGRYYIMSLMLPAGGLHAERAYHLRTADEASAKAHPGTLGYLLGEHWNLADAQAAAERHH